MVIFILISSIGIALDQILKIVFWGKSFSLLGDFLWVESAFNQGAAFGSFSGARWFFIVLAIIAVGCLIFFAIRKTFGYSQFLMITYGLLLAGIVGNLIDRIFLAGVRDFIYFKFINFAIFNIADALITIGVVMLIVYILFLYKSPKKTGEKTND